MKALLCTHYGPPEDLEVVEIVDPVPGPGEVLVRIKAAALNFFDTLIIQGKYQTKPTFPFSPSAEFAGVVESVGANVTDFKAGDRVLGFTGYGAAREKIAVPTKALTPIPDDLDFDRAAGLCVTYGTTLYALKDRAHLKPGEMLAVLGASGGTGLAAIEIGKIMGARVIACASSPEKVAFCKERGADDGIDYAAEDLKEALRKVTGGKGADVIYDPVGGAYAEAALRAIAWEGRFLVVGFAAGEIPKVPFNLFLLKSANVLGVFWGAWTERDPAGHRDNVAQLLRWAADGKLSSHVHAVYLLDEAAQALKAIAERKVMGKVILRP
ncbi:NADPH:quinone oxidoreductase [Pseudolabrys sp. Root1462]|uniref:NADPH:quinone oxidoreductase family protein n=1 Tax=Pseudolabrys sp. Root1462 TaxID=1736466 RepID=UPI000703A38B|nr:NADPH:quinone oxidoreductase family protein [Pseudolabrys sp. Root1462]KQY97970.1 NADPH:quinone oxidoreductase [Pseudolabrys sp. Root1462]